MAEDKKLGDLLYREDLLLSETKEASAAILRRIMTHAYEDLEQRIQEALENNVTPQQVLQTAAILSFKLQKMSHILYPEGKSRDELRIVEDQVLGVAGLEADILWRAWASTISYRLQSLLKRNQDIPHSFSGGGKELMEKMKSEGMLNLGSISPLGFLREWGSRQEGPQGTPRFVYTVALKEE